MLYALLNSIGLGLTATGASVLWWVTPVYSGAPSFFADKEVLAEIKQVAARKERNARRGFVLIIVGTMVQLITIWAPMVCSP